LDRSVSRICCRIRGYTDYKAIPSANFQNLGAFSFLFEFVIVMKRVRVGVPKITSLIHRLRQRHTQLVREEVERTVLDPTEVEAELHALCEALVQAKGRVRA
jgi:hypothetical protein